MPCRPGTPITQLRGTGRLLEPHRLVGTETPSYRGFRYPGGDHQSSCVAVLPVPAELPRGAGDDAAVRDRGVPRNHLAMVREVRANLRQRAASLSAPARDTWHLDEVFLTINDQRQYLGAVDQDGNVLDILVTPRRDTKVATRFFSQVVQGVGAELVIHVMRSGERDKGGCCIARSHPLVHTTGGCTSNDLDTNRSVDSSKHPTMIYAHAAHEERSSERCIEFPSPIPSQPAILSLACILLPCGPRMTIRVCASLVRRTGPPRPGRSRPRPPRQGGVLHVRACGRRCA
jgi:DDE domain